MRNDRNALEVLTRPECLRLLSTVRIGRLGISIGALPVILPVRFALLDDTIAFRCAPGSKLDSAVAGAVVAFEADHIDQAAEGGWSVLAQGVAQAVDDARRLADLQALELRPWGSGGDDRYVRIETQIISGRRL